MKTNNVQPNGLLTGINALDLADEKASFCTKILADLGARIIKIEKPGGNQSRKKGPFLNNVPRPQQSLSFYYNNIGKSGITLDIENKKGRSIFLRLLEITDVVVETFPPGYLEEIGLSFEMLSKTNPKLILVSVTGFGQDGPRSKFKSCDLVASAFGGQMYISGAPSTPPLKLFGEQSYLTASLFAAIGALLALRKREQTGKGDHIDISLQESVCSTLEHVMIQFFYERNISKRQGNRNWNNAFCILPCKDGFIHLTVFQNWETLVEWMANEGIATDLTDEKWRNEEYRRQHLDHIAEILEQWTRTHTVDELVELGQLMRFPWAPVHTPRKVLNSPHLKARGFFIDIDHPEIGTTLKYAGLPYKFSSQFKTPCKRPPLIGEDNIQIYLKGLGLSEKELQSLSSSSTI